jgi:hypothetical protein
MVPCKIRKFRANQDPFLLVIFLGLASEPVLSQSQRKSIRMSYHVN